MRRRHDLNHPIMETGHNNQQVSKGIVPSAGYTGSMTRWDDISTLMDDSCTKLSAKLHHRLYKTCKPKETNNHRYRPIGGLHL